MQLVNSSNGIPGALIGLWGLTGRRKAQRSPVHSSPQHHANKRNRRRNRVCARSVDVAGVCLKCTRGFGAPFGPPSAWLVENQPEPNTKTRTQSRRVRKSLIGESGLLSGAAPCRAIDNQQARYQMDAIVGRYKNRIHYRQAKSSLNA